MSTCLPNNQFSDKYYIASIQIFENNEHVRWRTFCNWLYINGTNPRCRITIRANGTLYESVKSIADVSMMLFKGGINSSGRMSNSEVKDNILAAFDGRCVRILNNVIDWRDFTPISG
jgi:hypothetical protein